MAIRQNETVSNASRVEVFAYDNFLGSDEVGSGRRRARRIERLEFSIVVGETVNDTAGICPRTDARALRVRTAEEGGSNRARIVDLRVCGVRPIPFRLADF